MYMPSIKNARRVDSFIIGHYIAVLLTECESIGMIDYQHVVFVYLPDPENKDKPQIVMAVAAELSSALAGMRNDDEPPSYFLGVFPGDGHHNLGASPDWADIDLFRDRAFEVIQDYLKIEKAPMRIPDDAGRRPHTDD